MSLHRRSIVFGACLIADVMLVAGPISAAPLDYLLDVQEIGPQHSHITVRLRNIAQGNKPVDGTILSIDAVEGPRGVDSNFQYAEAVKLLVAAFSCADCFGTGRACCGSALFSSTSTA